MISLLLAAALSTGTPIPQGANVAPDGGRLDVTSKALLYNGSPIVPMMGEIHYSRLPADEWRDQLLKMKEGGVTIVSTYVFWSHHEWERGEYRFDGSRNLSKFLETVKECGLWAIVRIGPWAHGEVREGGFPDWLVAEAAERSKAKKGKISNVLRTTDAWFMEETRKFWTRLAPEVLPHLWKNGGPVVGIQLENESRGPWAYYQELKRLAVELGYDAPMYTRTGWPRLNGGERTFGEMIPLYGDYAEGFWDRQTTSMPNAEYRNAFAMKEVRMSAAIATEQLGAQKAEDAKGAAQYPYFTCELGGGMASSYHRRLVMEPMDAFALGVVKLGSGSNLPGYYMYRGGTNPTDQGVPMGESQSDRFTNYNDLPPISYEFQSPLSEFGVRQKSWWLLRDLGRFCAKYGGEFALEEPVFTSRNESRRGRFIFHNEYVRRINPSGECWIGVEENGNIRRIVDGRHDDGALDDSPVEADPVVVTPLSVAGNPLPVKLGVNGVATPDPNAWSTAATWAVELPEDRNCILEISYRGDMARLEADGVPVADDFYNGDAFRFALWRLPKHVVKLDFKVTPWPGGDAIFLDTAPVPALGEASVSRAVSLPQPR